MSADFTLLIAPERRWLKVADITRSQLYTFTLLRERGG
jgi:hypothetical protein